MKTLVLCVDRDDDLGVKTGIEGPIVGRDRNLAAAVKLGVADPEDADVNTMLTAVSIYDELAESGQEAEIATILGDVRVGPISDRTLTRQLDEVIEEVQPDTVYLVTDGAEDEAISPMVASRIRVDHVRRVFVRQSPSLESTYYHVMRVFKERRILVPIGLALIVLGVMAYLNPLLAPAIVAVVLGAYLLLVSAPFSLHPADLAHRIGEAYDSLRDSVLSGNVSIIFSSIAGILFLVGIAIGIDTARPAATAIEGVIRFIAGALIWSILGLLFFEGGRVANAYFKKGRVPGHVLIVSTTFIALGLVILAAVTSLELLILPGQSGSTVPLILVAIGLAVLIVIAGGLSYRTKQDLAEEDSWRH